MKKNGPRRNRFARGAAPRARKARGARLQRPTPSSNNKAFERASQLLHKRNFREAKEIFEKDARVRGEMASKRQVSHSDLRAGGWRRSPGPRRPRLGALQHELCTDHQHAKSEQARQNSGRASRWQPRRSVTTHGRLQALSETGGEI